MTYIKIEVPNDDHIALRAFGKALEEMALAHGAEPVQLETYYNVTMNGEQNDQLRQKLKNVLGEPRDGDIDVTRAMVEQCAPIIDTTAQQVESLATHIIISQEKVGDPVDLGDGNLSQGYRVEMQELPTTDSTGTPWDERIHSASKALNADGTWRLRRKPKDMGEAEWNAQVEVVKAELMWKKCDPEVLEQMTDAEMDTSGEPPVTSPTVNEVHQLLQETNDAVTPPGDDFHAVAGIPPLPVPPPVVVAPPVPEVTTWDFPHLMTFLTERHGKIDVATVNTLLAQDGMSSVQELNVHPDKIGPFVARVKAHLGE